ncbi:hypothetical protein F2P81_010108 [Scophthalmus maximus]|uniref:Uncharacterized protein n=1 Tax=Scophthalmus maximus TaxID=52904 RepID=A0A6A4T1Z1_SCOMX|nr:hypothetical protein F2P81_010108 [Scophthalmus maximus]
MTQHLQEETKTGHDNKDGTVDGCESPSRKYPKKGPIEGVVEIWSKDGRCKSLSISFVSERNVCGRDPSIKTDSAVSDEESYQCEKEKGEYKICRVPRGGGGREV